MLEESGFDLISLHSFLKNVDDVLPTIDVAIIASVLGRPDWKIDLTPFRLSQTMYYWRLTAKHILLLAAYSPGPEYLRLSDIMQQHYVESIPKKNVSVTDVNCLSPFEGMTRSINWIASIKGLPLSVLQVVIHIIS